ncbi:MAG: hypothetical protein PUE01_09775 [Clostridiaceae bacterium]|nr:hypothetical protein [Clostridiaceae bacterium]
MALWFNNLKTIIRQKQDILRIVLLIFILILLFYNALILLSKEYPVSINSTNYFCAEAPTKSVHVFRTNKTQVNENKDSKIAIQ